VFDVVSVPESISPNGDLEDDYGFVATAVAYSEMLAQVGFSDIGSEDTTPGYLDVAGRWLDAAGDLEIELRDAMGDAMFDDKYASRADSYEMIKSGTLGRTLYWARR
jgi:hypothetical protein